MAKDMPMSAISRLVKEHDTQLWRIIHYPELFIALPSINQKGSDTKCLDEISLSPKR
ncbi:transposase family protein [Fictibacillus enclensis]|uniref:transposase family protein n=1 Tax=Fictibacillus enclensis TaxID=1017270 RepID=UPI003CD0D9AB